MIIEEKYFNIDTNGYPSANFEKITQCPICHKIGDFKMLYACAYEETAYSLHFCHFCQDVFSTVYKEEYHCFYIHNQYPAFIEETNIPDQIIALSPQFSTIYEQALRAEQEHLDQIAGLGYRRALEFLVKDSAISKQTDEKDKIQAMPMAQCIERFIEHPRTKALAKRAAWLGNDYAHYLKKHTDRDLKDLKALISLTVQWINLEIESTAYESEITYQK